LIDDHDQGRAIIKNWDFSGFFKSLGTFGIMQVHNCMKCIRLWKCFLNILLQKSYILYLKCVLEIETSVVFGSPFSFILSLLDENAFKF